MKKFFTLVALLLITGWASTTVAQTVNVTFQVDMRIQIKNGTFNPVSDVVTVPGGFNEWLNEPPANTDKVMADADGDSIYSKTIAMAPTTSFEYKYNIGLGWDGKDESSNRSFISPIADSTLAPVWYNNVTGAFKHVTFKVDMSLPIKAGDVTPGVTKVYLAGSFTDWQNSAREMTKSSSDSTYSYMTVVPDDSVRSGDNVKFKFVYSAGAASAGTWESISDRSFIVPEADSSNFSAFWDDQNPNVTLGSGNITFKVDMSVMSNIGIFNNSSDSLQIRGNFNGWSDSDPAKSSMNQNAISPNEYLITSAFTNVVVGARQDFKFFMKNKATSGLDTLWKDGYERPLQTGGNNWGFLFPGKDTTISLLYDGVSPNWVIPSGKSLQVKFTVDMTDAMDPAKQAVVFDPAADTLFWINEQPSFTRSQGWVDDDHMKVLKLTQVSGNIYSGTLTVNGPSFNAFEYRYAWQKADGNWISEPGALGTDFTYRVRFVGQNTNNNWPVNPWTMPTDTWQFADVKTDQEIDPFDSYTKYVGLKNENVEPNTYSLSQNYPNPFNPSTVIKFSIQNPGFVTLRIYNVLGQEVATLVNEDLKTGTYTYSFNASKLSSGIYFYTIKSGNFVQTKKMVLLK